MKFNKEAYAKAEIELARMGLIKNPDNIQQKDRLAYWLSELGQKEEALKYASKEMADKINGK